MPICAVQWHWLWIAKFYRHSQQRQGQDRRSDAAAAGRRVGNDAGASRDIAGLWARRAEKSRRRTQNHGKARPWAGQAIALKVSARNLNSYRDPAVIAIHQLKELYIDGELDTVVVGPGKAHANVPAFSTQGEEQW
jgi:hypothetical protein